jgi:GT2 family glycosyltransferase
MQYAPKDMGEIDKDHTSTTLSDHEGSPYIGGIIAVVVLYNVRVEECVTINSLNKSLESVEETMDLVVWDNSYSSTLEDGSIFVYGCFRIHYFHDALNSGVSKAFNFAAKYGAELRKQWILLLDQDSSFPVHTISSYLLGLSGFPHIRLFVPVLKVSDDLIFSPSRFLFKRGFALKKIIPGIHRFQHLSPVNSGMLVDIDSFIMVGGYKEKVKLDFSDFQFIERFKKKYASFCVLDLVVRQAFSDEERDWNKLNERFGYYCEGARNCDKGSVWDWVGYFLVVFFRGCSLVIRTGKLVFFRTFINRFVRGL